MLLQISVISLNNTNSLICFDNWEGVLCLCSTVKTTVFHLLIKASQYFGHFVCLLLVFGITASLRETCI